MSLRILITCLGLSAMHIIHTNELQVKLTSLNHFIDELAQKTKARIGLNAYHSPTGIELSYHDADFFVMASTFKLPLAIFCLKKVDAKDLSLDQKIQVTLSDLREGSGKLNAMTIPANLALADLIKLMMEHSDNTATDIILKLSGGPEKIYEWIKSLSFQEIIGNSSCLSLLSLYYGIKNAPADGKCTPAQFSKLKQQVPAREKTLAANQFLSCCPDRATPREMNKLLQKLVRGELLLPSSQQFLLQSMSLCKTGLNRIRGALPAHVFVADKTGTIGALIGDVGMIRLPNDKGQLFIAIYVQDEKRSIKEREQIIAQIAKKLYQFFVTLNC